MVKVLFVCTGNICRSPTADGVFRALVAAEGLAERIGVDSAGTHAYHVGEPPDSRSAEAARRRGYELQDLRARQLKKSDFEEFDLLLAMDRGHLDLMARACPPERRDRLALFLSFAPQLGLKDVPDPYYGQGGGFERVLDMIEAGSAGLLAHIRERML
ncbi:low molecular weight protein-tyrosine-phosphatase [Paramagnetospirillum magneticum]|uniref:protein-tyrosine-phosphatase n=1 Tax=Paramagnetospirillum magneticum (strain ATCC 700264 / AMB-1) TaxID=342108 RepID=Q2W902_PARM1|nr:low molecular weight protein-tyrosine-phosphatase [Paramagnetospirillum magneticum]BAE49673.1 Protein-tyrosine-phosphatase [Paramagnetospirillum magneticum AMB-1]